MTGHSGKTDLPENTTGDANDSSAEAKLSRAVTAASDGIALIGPDGRLAYLNPALARMFHLDKPLNAYINEPWQDLYGPQGVEEIENNILPLLAEKKVWRGQSAVRRWDGTVFYAELTMDQLPDGSIVATARDVTERKEQESERDALQQKMYQTQKMEALGRLAGGVAHEFNNILASIVGYADFLMEDLDKDTEQHRFAGRIRKAGERGKELVSLVMSFSHPHRVSPRPVNLAEFITSTAPILKTALGSEANLSFETPEEPLYVRLDNGRMSEALLHICNNAADALFEDKNGRVTVDIARADLSRPELAELQSTHGEPETRLIYSLPFYEEGGPGRIHVGHLSPEKSYAVIRIRDNGPGIAADVLPHICDPFFTTRPPGFGSGLGLPAVVGVVGMHEGAMLISSRKDDGVCVELFLPEVAESEIPSAEAGSKDAAVLLVEHDDSVSGALARALERRGYEVICCQTGDEAAEVLGDITDGWAAVAAGPSVKDDIRSQIGKLAKNVPMLDFAADEDAGKFAARVETAGS